jgi:hypothetical protein
MIYVTKCEKTHSHTDGVHKETGIMGNFPRSSNVLTSMVANAEESKEDIIWFNKQVADNEN